MPAWSAPRPISSSARIIPRDSSPRSGRSSSGAGKPGSSTPGKPDRDGGADPEVPGAADDLARLALPHVDLAELELVGVRVLVGGDDRADAQEREVVARVGDPDVDDTVDLERRDGETARDLLRRRVDADVLAQPGEGHAASRTASRSGGRCARARAGRGTRAAASRSARGPSRRRSRCSAPGRSRRTRTASDRPCPRRRPRSSRSGGRRCSRPRRRRGTRRTPRSTAR